MSSLFDRQRAPRPRYPVSGNLFTQAIATFQSGWTAERATLTPNLERGPSGRTLGARLIEDATASNSHQILVTTTTTIPNVPMRLWLSGVRNHVAGTANRTIYVQSYDSIFDGSAEAIFAPATGAWVNAPSAGFGATRSAISGGFKRYPKGWFALWLDFTPNADTSIFTYLSLASAGSANYNGDAASGLHLEHAWLGVR